MFKFSKVALENSSNISVNKEDKFLQAENYLLNLIFGHRNEEMVSDSDSWNSDNQLGDFQAYLDEDDFENTKPTQKILKKNDTEPPREKPRMNSTAPFIDQKCTMEKMINFAFYMVCLLTLF